MLQGAYSHSLAEWALTACSWFGKDLPRLKVQQKDRNWEPYYVEELRQTHPMPASLCAGSLLAVLPVLDVLMCSHTVPAKFLDRRAAGALNSALCHRPNSHDAASICSIFMMHMETGCALCVVCRGKTLGVVGYGDIGQETANLARAFKMKIIALRRRKELSQHDKDLNLKVSNRLPLVLSSRLQPCAVDPGCILCCSIVLHHCSVSFLIARYMAHVVVHGP